MKKFFIWLGVGLILLACQAAQALSISDFHAQQRYPWNGKVDLTFNLNGPSTQGAVLQRAVASSIQIQEGQVL